MHQELLYIKEWEQRGIVPNALPIPLKEKPSRVWTLPTQCDEAARPTLPYTPMHGYNAFLEDEMHDWTWRGGVFRYRSRVAGSPVWVLLEYNV